MIDGPARMQVVASWTGGRADLLRQALRMTNESFAEHLGVAVRTVAYWRKRPETIPIPAMQETLDAALERVPDRAKAQFAMLISQAGADKRSDHVESFELPGGASDLRKRVCVTG
jgi:transcriptional regulator with XRE-family HTH domain